ncbi:MAG TPA: ribosome maturation factor RimM [Acetivibrio sp.]|jgi:16S rRNA processing protein RimM|nr:16S rRNA processing protein RimM [Clostridium sp.]HOQ36719.1 ribosome maturation factor RimM [Acetivibrio sp.]HPT90277.1 ribosome maturation factor RimM [Acetivibrio sp.]HQA57549.1 ribosome maturation factor RimM [Acetivibrio sp.]
MIQYLEVGKIINTHGIAGELKIMPLTDDPKRFDKLKWVYISPKISDEMKKYDVVRVRYHKNFVIMKVKDIDDLNTAEKYKEQFLIVDRKDAVKLPKDTFFICDLIGMEVFDEEGKSLGFLKEVLQTGSNDVYVVKGDNSREILIPALKSVVKKVCFEENKMEVILPQGLIDDEI